MDKKPVDEQQVLDYYKQYIKPDTKQKIYQLTWE